MSGKTKTGGEGAARRAAPEAAAAAVAAALEAAEAVMDENRELLARLG